MGAIALFGEKYSDEVRVVQFGRSIEFCGGVHAQRTGHIGVFRIVSESSVAAGVRRIEALTGLQVELLMDKAQDMLADLRALLNNVPDLSAAIRKSIDENAELKKQIESHLHEKQGEWKAKLLKEVKQIGDAQVVTLQAPIPASVVKDLAFQVVSELGEQTAFLACTIDEGKPMLTVMLGKGLVASGLHAGNMVKAAAAHIQGGGGGAPHFATAGGKLSSGLPAALSELLSILQ
jgi:alanyl-tRNA synthetase